METLYEKLKSRNYDEFTTCQLPNCDKPLEGRQRKYCSKEHALEAKKMYRKQWAHLHRDRVKSWNARYSAKVKKLKKEAIPYENTKVENN